MLFGCRIRNLSNRPPHRLEASNLKRVLRDTEVEDIRIQSAKGEENGDSASELSVKLWRATTGVSRGAEGLQKFTPPLVA